MKGFKRQTVALAVDGQSKVEVPGWVDRAAGRLAVCPSLVCETVEVSPAITYADGRRVEAVTEDRLVPAVRGSWTVTHVATGRSVLRGFERQADAARALRMLQALAGEVWAEDSVARVMALSEVEVDGRTVEVKTIVRAVSEVCHPATAAWVRRMKPARWSDWAMMLRSQPGWSDSDSALVAGKGGA